jgi:uncharacterized protein DUF6510
VIEIETWQLGPTGEKNVEETQLRLDGNAAAGMLREIFVHEMSTARGACASCGRIAQIGSEHLYISPLSPGAVLRCQICQQVLMVLIHKERGYRLALNGLKWIEISDAPEVAVRASA